MKHPGKLSSVKLYIELECRKPIDIGRLAKQFGVSPSALAHGFRIAYGVSPMSYARNLRMEKAARPLADGHSVKEAMYAAGMHSPSAFSRAFSRKYGVSPSEFKRHGGGRTIWPMTRDKQPYVLQHVSSGC